MLRKRTLKRSYALALAFILSLQMPTTVLAEDMQESFLKENLIESVQEDASDVMNIEGSEGESEKKSGWHGSIEENTCYYRDEKGNILTGLQKIDEKTYFFNEEGILQTGWQMIEENKFYFSLETGERYENGTYVIEGVTYVFDENGFLEIIADEDSEEIIEIPDSAVGKETDDILEPEKTEEKIEEVPKESEKVNEVHRGWYYDKGWYYYDNNGNKLYGWQKISGKWYYLDKSNLEKPGVMLADCSRVINGRIYFFEGGGVMLTGWVRRPEGWYHTDVNGAMQTGWQQIGKYWYYFDAKNVDYPGLMAVNGKKEINGYTYFFTGGGEMKTGWIHYPEGWYYAHPGGNQQIGWLKLGKNWYYLDGKNTEHPGLMLANCELTLGKYQYAFKSDGVMRTGWWFKPGEGYHFYDVAGYMRSGWVQTGGKWYYMDPKNNNVMLSNQWFRNGKYWYYLKESGEMAKGWLSLYGNKYYLSTDGVMRTGWQTIGGDKYYFYNENDAQNGKGWGVMARNTTIDGIKIGADGKAAIYSDCMARFTTVSTNDANGTYNMKKALGSFNQVVIEPGQTLSFFNVAGPCGKAEGYLPAGVVGGVGYGGGICQASTTLYGAALRAGLTIVERRNHSVPSTYVPIGQDAMVSYGASDLKIRNDYDFPVKLVTYSKGNTLYAEVWGTHPGWFDYISIESWYTSSRSAVAYRKYIKSGQTVKVEQLPSSYY